MTKKVVSMLAPGSVHVWTIRAADECEPGEWDLALLDRAERERALTFWPGPLRNKYVAVHAAVRRILGQYLDIAPDAVRLGRAPFGKPIVEGQPLAFNISQSGSFAVCAVADSGAVGIDIERRRRVPELDRMTQKFFTVAERAEILRCERPARLDAFFRLWTRKEALMKAGGLALRAAMDRIDTGGAIASGTSVDLNGQHGLTGTWELRSFTPSPGYLGAVAYSSELVSLDFFDWMPTYEPRALQAPMTLAQAVTRM